MIKSYKDSGVDKEEGYKAVELMKKNVLKTHNKSVLTNLGSFGAMYELGQYKNPVLISGTDGVGTKLEIAMKQKKYDTVGIDCVAMCVNDVLCHGAKPLFFLDYLACGKLDAEIAAQLVSGVTEGCLQSYAALIGGETAEMPGIYKENDYDLAGFCVGIADKTKIIDGKKNIKKGNIILALPSSGVHSNGFSLIRKIIFDHKNIPLNTYIEELQKTLQEELLTPTKIYAKAVLAVLEKHKINGLCHITGGGIYENVPRVLSENLDAKLYESKLPQKKIFQLLRQWADISKEEMFGTFNMGIGMLLFVEKEDAEPIKSILKNLNEQVYEVGEVIEGNARVILQEG